MAHSSTLQAPSGLTDGRHGRSWLLPHNRRLRNLVSVSLRNILVFETPLSNSRGKTIDDDALPQAKQSPAKRVALREQKALEHSRSSSNLRSVFDNTSATDIQNRDILRSDGIDVFSTATKPGADDASNVKRPLSGRARRRSTMDWASAAPHRRQETLQKSMYNRVVDVFFSVHINGIKEPVYVSETLDSAMNPTFRNIEWAGCGAGILRLGHVRIRFWARTEKFGMWEQLSYIKLDLRELYFLGKSTGLIMHSRPTQLYCTSQTGSMRRRLSSAWRCRRALFTTPQR